MREHARVIIIRPDRTLLMLQRAADDEWGAGRWEFPGGELDEGESRPEGAARELGEESGVWVAAQQMVYLGSWERPGKPPTSYFLVESEAEVRLSFEHQQINWVPELAACQGDVLDFPPGRRISLTPSARIGLALLEEYRC